MTTITQSISSLGSVPTTADPATFDSRADTFLGTALPTLRTEINTWAGQANTVAGEVNANKVAAELAETNAEAAQAAAEVAETNAETAETNAEAAAVTAVAAANTASLGATNASGTSTTSLAIGTGSKTLTTQTAKGFLPGMTVKVFYDVSNYMTGTVTDYNSGTGSMTFSSTVLVGSGTYADWDITLTVAPGGITSVTTATTATTLTAVPTLLQITPASYGVVVTLPDARTMAEGGPVHCIDNRGSYPVIVKNTSGTLLGFVPVKIASFISLDDNATADGVWGFSAIDAIAPTALIETAVFTGGLTTVSAGGRASVDMGGGIEIVLGTRSSDGHLYAIAHNYSTGVSGTPTAIRAADVDGTVRAAHVRHSATQLLVVSCGNGNTNLEAVIVTLNTGTLALTPNTAATATLSANITAMADGCGLLAVPSLPDSFVLTCTLATPAAQMRAISVSGTTVTIGSASSLDGTTGALTVTTGAIAIAVSSDGATYYAKPYTVSGSSLSAGTGFTDGAYSSVTINKLFPLGSRWVCLFNSNGTSGSVIGSILTLSGTVVTDTTATVFGGTASLVDAGVVNGKVIVMNNAGSSNFNLLTDTAGTASAGTAISVGNAGRFWYASGSIAYASSTTSGVAIDCSGASPVLSRTLNSVASASSSNSVLSLAGDMISVSNGVLKPTSPTSAAGVVAIGIRAGELFTELPSWTFTPTTYRGFTDKQRWGYNNANLLGKLEAA